MSTRRSPLARWFALAVLPAALASIAPVVHWCAMPWECVRLDALVACSERVETASDWHPRAVPVSCPTHGCPFEACGDAAGGPANCPLSSAPRAYLLSDPFGGLARGSQPPHVEGPAPGAELARAESDFAPLLAFASAPRVPPARPPTRPWSARPPARAPPCA